ncbi:DNA cytosine methyltransferase [Pseudomonas lini]
MLIGGPPCQAYSIVGRSRNQGKADYSAENDHRHFLYKEYLRIIKERKPAVFRHGKREGDSVLENCR